MRPALMIVAIVLALTGGSAAMNNEGPEAGTLLQLDDKFVYILGYVPRGQLVDKFDQGTACYETRLKDVNRDPNEWEVLWEISLEWTKRVFAGLLSNTTLYGGYNPPAFGLPSCDSIRLEMLYMDWKSKQLL